MATDAPAAYAPSRPLPPVGAYLRTVVDVGMRSIPTALPALVLLWFYHFGMALYLELAGAGTSPLGYPDSRAHLVQLFMKISAYLPLLVLVYTPFLPLQDWLLRGERRSFLSAIRHVLERVLPFVLSALLQMAIILLPVFVMFGILLLVVTPFPDLPRELVALLAVVTVGPALLWVFLTGMFLVFAVPAVVLDGHGPGRSIRVSIRLVAGHFWGILGRFIIFFLALFAAVMIASIPAALLSVGAATASGAESVFRIAGLLWTSLITAMTFPFWVAALLVLYRALVPAPETTAAAALAGVLAEERPVLEGGEHPTPFIFE
jgi:hypothetical protein